MVCNVRYFKSNKNIKYVSLLSNLLRIWWKVSLWRRVIDTATNDDSSQNKLNFQDERRKQWHLCNTIACVIHEQIKGCIISHCCKQYNRSTDLQVVTKLTCSECSHSRAKIYILGEIRRIYALINENFNKSEVTL